MRILGIDPGYGNCGWSVITDDYKLIDHGLITSSPDKRFDERLFYINKKLHELINTYNPQSAALEKIFFSKNTSTAMDVAKLIGVVILTLKMNYIYYEEYTPMQIKKALTSFGRSPKYQIQTMIKHIYNIHDLTAQDDVFDAIAVATCHCLHHKQSMAQKRLP